MTKTLNMIEDWKQEIAVAWLVKQALMEADQEKIWPYHLPEIAATEADIKEAEAMLGFSLDERYRGFLLHANGWRGFWHQPTYLAPVTSFADQGTKTLNLCSPC